MQGLRGATVARLTPDQKVACSNHVGVIDSFYLPQSIFNTRYKFGNLFLFLWHFPLTFPIVDEVASAKGHISANFYTHQLSVWWRKLLNTIFRRFYVALHAISRNIDKMSPKSWKGDQKSEKLSADFPFFQFSFVATLSHWLSRLGFETYWNAIRDTRRAKFWRKVRSFYIPGRTAWTNRVRKR